MSAEKSAGDEHASIASAQARWHHMHHLAHRAHRGVLDALDHATGRLELTTIATASSSSCSSGGIAAPPRTAAPGSADGPHWIAEPSGRSTSRRRVRSLSSKRPASSTQGEWRCVCSRDSSRSMPVELDMVLRLGRPSGQEPTSSCRVGHLLGRGCTPGDVCAGERLLPTADGKEQARG